MRGLVFVLFMMISFLAQGQSYTSYFTGNTIDTLSNPQGGVCLMGGATEDDNAMQWFLNRANGGDVLVLRASGSDGYNDYFFSELGVQINSVETIVCHSELVKNEAYIMDKIEKAEAIWFAGGDQWKYISFWRASEISKHINDALANRNIVIGGTSAGMAILGEYYFSAEVNTVSSEEALTNPYHPAVTPDSAEFLKIPYLKNTITDTHYDNPDRKGRHASFLARMFKDYGILPFGIACEEYTAVCIDPEGIARVYGQYPQFDDKAYFIQTNCALDLVSPERCVPDSTLIWNRDNRALKVFVANGDPTGSNSIDLNDWKTIENGSWENWWIEDGTLFSNESVFENCLNTQLEYEVLQSSIVLSPNPIKDTMQVVLPDIINAELSVVNQQGISVFSYSSGSSDRISLSLDFLTSGNYTLVIEIDQQVIHKAFVKI